MIQRELPCTALAVALAAAAIVLLLALTPMRGEAQSAQAEQPEQTAAEDTERNAERGEETQERRSGNPSEVFIPTEDISEDFAVSFPVDI